MDAKITKTRLGRMLSYDWLKIVGTIAAIILVWSLIFTMTATRITPAQQFHVLNYAGNYSLGDTFYKMYSDANGVLSYEVMEYRSEDLSANEEYLTTLMEARLATYEVDVMFVSERGDEDTEYTNKETGETEYEYTYLETFIVRYGYHLHMLSDPTKDENSYFNKMEVYLNTYYSDWKDENTFMPELVEKDFRARVKKNKDKRFKTEKQIKEGVEKDIERIQSYRDGLEQFYQYVADGYIAYNDVDFTYVRGDDTEQNYKGGYTLNICPDEDKMGKLKNYVSYPVVETDEDGHKTYKKSAVDMNVAFFDAGKKMEDGFQYENVLFINYLVKTCLEQTA